MIPIGGIVGAVFLVSRLVRAASGKSQAPARDPLARPNDYLALTILFILPITLGTVLALMEGTWWCAPFAVLGLMLSFPWRTARWLFIPLGWPRAAVWFAARASFSLGPDRDGARALAAAWALLRARSANPGERARTEATLENSPRPLRGAGVVAFGLLAAGRGDLEAARVLCRSVFHLDPRAALLLTCKVALEWSLAEAAATGRWEDVIELAGTGRGSWRLAVFFRGAARRLLGRGDAPGKAGLCLRWLAAPRRVATWPLLRRALAAGGLPEIPIPASGEPVADGPGLLRLALERHTVLAAAPPGQELTALAAAASAWDVALGSEATRAWAHARAEAVDPAGSTGALEALTAQVQEELAAWALERNLALASLPPGGQILEGIALRARNEVLDRIDSAAVAMASRVASKEELSPREEWQAFLSLERQCELARRIGGEDARRLAFEAVHAPICNLGAWLFNERDQRSIANGMFRWLLAEAREVGGEEEIRRYKRNVDCGP